MLFSPYCLSPDEWTISHWTMECAPQPGGLSGPGTWIQTARMLLGQGWLNEHLEGYQCPSRPAPGNHSQIRTSRGLPCPSGQTLGNNSPVVVSPLTNYNTWRAPCWPKKKGEACALASAAEHHAIYASWRSSSSRWSRRLTSDMVWPDRWCERVIKSHGRGWVTWMNLKAQILVVVLIWKKSYKQWIHLRTNHCLISGENHAFGRTVFWNYHCDIKVCFVVICFENSQKGGMSMSNDFEHVKPNAKLFIAIIL